MENIPFQMSLDNIVHINFQQMSQAVTYHKFCKRGKNLELKDLASFMLIAYKLF
jgi:hypothetical protein